MYSYSTGHRRIIPGPEKEWRRRKAAAPSFSSYLSWSICGLCCRQYIAHVQLMYGSYMAYV